MVLAEIEGLKTMILSTIHELMFIGVGDAGVPNQERIIIRPTEKVNLAGFGLHVGLLQNNGMVLPLWDHFFWFGDVVVDTPSWIFVYTGPGTPTVTNLPDRSDKAYIFHWGKPSTIFATGGAIVPVLLKYDAICIGPALQNISK